MCLNYLIPSNIFHFSVYFTLTLVFLPTLYSPRPVALLPILFKHVCKVSPPGRFRGVKPCLQISHSSKRVNLIKGIPATSQQQGLLVFTTITSLPFTNLHYKPSLRALRSNTLTSVICPSFTKNEPVSVT